MIIDNVESLRIWLTEKLKPICDADPSALAKYVVALIKKEKPLNELRDVCVDQLDVFLADETKPFVTSLFEALETKSYLPQNTLMIQSVKQVEKEPSLLPGPEPAPTPGQKADSVKEIEPEAETEVKKPQETPKEPADETKEETDQSSEPNKENNKNLIIPDETSKRRVIDDKTIDSNVVRGHSRYSRHSRREKDFETSVEEFLNAKKPRNDAERSVRLGRSTSPSSRRSPRRTSPSARRYRSRRERRKRSADRRGSRRRARCRDYDEKGFCLLGNSCPYDHGRDPVVVDDVNIPNILGVPTIPTAPPQVAPLPEIYPGIFPMSATSIIPANPVVSIPSGALSLDTGLTLVGGQQRPLPTVAELPQKVPMLAQPHPALAAIQPALTAIQPVVEEDKNEIKVESPKKVTAEVSKATGGNEAYNPEEPSIDVIEPVQPVKPVPSWTGSISSTTVVQSLSRDIFSLANHIPPASITAEQFLRKMYTPSSTFLPSQIVAPPLPDAVKTILQRTAMTMPPQIPVVSHVIPRPVSSLAAVPQAPVVASPPRRPFMNQTILEIRKVPKELNTVVKISEYFQKFGNIVNIQVQYENDLQAALIQFSSNAEARRAYSSPEAVLGNRFIKLFWHNKTKELPPMDPSQLATSLPNSVKLAQDGVDTSTASGKSMPLSKLPASGQTTYVNPENTPQALQKKQAEQKKEALKKKLEIQKQRRMLLEKQIKEQKDLITKLEKNKNMSPAEKQLLMKALKMLTNSIDKLKTDLQNQAKTNKPKSKQALQKELLDREIELYNKQASGEDITDTRNAMNELQKEAGVYSTVRGKPVVRARGRGRGLLASRGRGFSASSANQHTSRAVVDNRPKQILVTGYDEQDKDAVVAQFASYGEIDRVEEKPGSKLVLSFHTRKQAEIAASKAGQFNGKRLVLAWYSAVQHTKRNSTSTNDSSTPAKVQRRETRRSSVSSLLSKDDKDDDDYDLLDDLDDKEADLLLLEEDEEEDEERSWKR